MKKGDECDTLLKECDRRNTLIAALTADKDKAAAAAAAAQAKLRKLGQEAAAGPPIAAVDASKVGKLCVSTHRDRCPCVCLHCMTAQTHVGVGAVFSICCPCCVCLWVCVAVYIVQLKDYVEQVLQLQSDKDELLIKLVVLQQRQQQQQAGAASAAADNSASGDAALEQQQQQVLELRLQKEQAVATVVRLKQQLQELFHAAIVGVQASGVEAPVSSRPASSAGRQGVGSAHSGLSHST